MSTRRFAIPSHRLRRGWGFGPDNARLVEARPLSFEEYSAAHAEIGSVYFIGDQMGGDTIKIGWSRDPVTRMQQLQTGNPMPLKFWGIVAASRMIEPALHLLFANSSVNGEWFTDPEGSILAWLREMTFDQPIQSCRWFTAGSQNVTWEWDDKALLHRPVFGEPAE